MRPRRDLGYNAAEAGMEVSLRGHNAGEDPRLLGEDSGRGFVTRGFDREEVHRVIVTACCRNSAMTAYRCGHAVGRKGARWFPPAARSSENAGMWTNWPIGDIPAQGTTWDCPA